MDACERKSALSRFGNIGYHTFFVPLCGVILMVLCVQQVKAEPATIIETQIRLSEWLNTKLNFAGQLSTQPSESKQFVPYLPGLVWMVPEEAVEQARIKSQLLEHIKAGDFVYGVSHADATKLASFVESLPVTGRVVVERTDPRWLEVNPLHDPVLKQGQSVSIPARPTSVTVVRGDGYNCQVAHSVRALAMDYVRKCDSSFTPQFVWIVQPDGLVQRRGVAAWNETEQDPASPRCMDCNG